MRGGCGGVADPPFTIENGRTLTMQKTSTIWGLLFRGAALLAALITPALAFAQSCALCYSQAAGSGARLIQALRSGILILVFPPMLICIGLAIMAYRKRNQFDEE
jgi:hypothetical protein